MDRESIMSGDMAETGVWALTRCLIFWSQRIGSRTQDLHAHGSLSFERLANMSSIYCSRSNLKREQESGLVRK